MQAACLLCEQALSYCYQCNLHVESRSNVPSDTYKLRGVSYSLHAGQTVRKPPPYQGVASIRWGQQRERQNLRQMSSIGR